MALATKDEALEALEIARRDYLAEARRVAVEIAQAGNGTVTVDDIWERCPPPAGIDRRVMGAVMRPPEWVQIGFARSRRRVCHGRPVGRFRYVGQQPEKVPA